jgi:hypothetical protein
MSIYKSLKTLAARLRDDLNNPTKSISLVLIYAFNRTGKTRLSMEFKDTGKRKNRKNPTGAPDTLYFNAFTEDLFVWENDLQGNSLRRLQLNENSSFFNAMADLALDETIAKYLSRYADFDFDFSYTEVNRGNETFFRPHSVSFRKDGNSNIKVSRGEQNIFIWCVFMAICERMLDGHESYQGRKYIFIDDPISSLDDNNSIAIACDLAKLLRQAATRKNDDGAPAPIKVVVSSHHTLFFNVICNEVSRKDNDLPAIPHRRYFLYRPSNEAVYTLQAAEHTPFFHHVAILAELQRAADPKKGKLYTFHFNALRSIMEKTASFFGHPGIAFCLKALDDKEDRALFNRALNALSHGASTIYEHSEMSESERALFRRILLGFTQKFDFALADVGPVPHSGQSLTPAPQEAPAR